MKIGVVASGFEMLPLFKFLSQYDYEYHIFLDLKYGPWGDKSNVLKQERVNVGIEYFRDKMDVIIVDPIEELRKQGDEEILPLFATYMKEHVLKYSLVGKLGLLCDHSDMENVENLLGTILKDYILTENQKNIKKFHHNFPLWKKEVRMWKYFLTTYGARSPLVRQTIKHDLRYFRDASVDTIVPMSRGFLFYDKILHTRLNWKKVKFYGTKIVQECFEEIIKQYGKKEKSNSSYSVTLHCTDIPGILLQEKKWMWLLERGKSVTVKVEDVFV